MKSSGWSKVIYGIFILVLIMVNPPIVYYVSDYAGTHPFVLGWPTLLVWLDFWYFVGIAAFVIGALTIESWKRVYKEFK